MAHHLSNARAKLSNMSSVGQSGHLGCRSLGFFKVKEIPRPPSVQVYGSHDGKH